MVTKNILLKIANILASVYGSQFSYSLKFNEMHVPVHKGKRDEAIRMSYKLYWAHTRTQTQSKVDNRNTSMPKHNYTRVLLTWRCLNGEQALTPIIQPEVGFNWLGTSVINLKKRISKHSQSSLLFDPFSHLQHYCGSMWTQDIK